MIAVTKRTNNSHVSPAQLALFVKADSWRVVLTLGDQHTEDAARGIPGSLTEPSRVL